VDQWFSESQFEAYRALGYHAVTTSFSGVPSADRTSQADAAGDPLCAELSKIFEDFGFVSKPRMRPAELAG
jgi:hypothetical protein